MSVIYRIVKCMHQSHTVLDYIQGGIINICPTYIMTWLKYKQLHVLFEHNQTNKQIRKKETNKTLKHIISNYPLKIYRFITIYIQ